MELVDKDTLLECPYNKVHLIRAKRFQYHLMKCRKQYVGNDMVTCPFNAKHVVPRPEERHHIQTCVDKVLIEADAEHNTRLRNNEYQGNISVPPYFPDKDIQPATESWDDELEECEPRYSYPPPRENNGMWGYQAESYPVNNGFNRLHQQPPSALRQPRTQPASMVQSQQDHHPQDQPLSYHQPSPPSSQTHQESSNIAQGPQTEPARVPSASTPSWANIAGFGRGFSRTAPEHTAGITPGIGRGVVRPPPGFGRGHAGQRGPTIAANIYNNPQS